MRDVRGWAMKLYTDEGNLDWVFNNTVRLTSRYDGESPAYLRFIQPIFFVRDPMKFPSLNRSHKRHPATNMPDADMVALSADTRPRYYC